MTDPRDLARQRAINAIAKRDWSSSRLREHLITRGSPPEVAEDVIANLRQTGIIDDHELALRLADSALAREPIAATVLSDRLERRGFDRDTARTAAREAVARIDIEGKTRAFVEVRLRTSTPRRIAAQLARRGLDDDAVRAALAAAGAEIGDDACDSP